MLTFKKSSSDNKYNYGTVSEKGDIYFTVEGYLPEDKKSYVFNYHVGTTASGDGLPPKQKFKIPKAESKEVIRDIKKTLNLPNTNNPKCRIL